MSGAVRAAGAVLWRRCPHGHVEVAVVHRPRYDDWSLPKGKLDPGETAPVAAVRELAEETGFEAVLGRFLTRVEYDLGGVPKVVDYFSARANSGRFTPNDEVDELRWLRQEEATTMVHYDTDRQVLARFAALPAELTTLLLVRHAKAGRRDAWTGDDDLRPLSEAGVRQARALRVLLRSFSPDRVLSAPRLRCVQTVQGVADDAGVEVEHEPLMSEEVYWADPAAALRRLRDIVVAGGTPVVCSQGGVIPDVVNALAQQDGVVLPATKADGVASKKGSVWLLSFTQGPDRVPRLVDAAYLPSPLPAPVPAGG
ncbi:phosphohistidine phosphatase SixA [Saccharomonospora marina XMU15]|uniref:Phosphohistidine phosphatase SixA n=1 Tax=Saccharomonospora marina XMU15 TaxID=882083 RepID=H5WYH2_9PSEU|nr:NUDIX hydrolase [Saccharomonospora marina]EHR49563.1 phosphohistidine phosphatase SixA [Saccharomonospora marina XMU15]